MKKSKTFRGIGFVMLAMIVLRIGFSFIASLFLRWVPDAPLNIIAELVYLIPVIVFVLLHKEESKKTMRLKPIHPLSVLLLIVMGFLTIPVTGVVNLISQFFVSNTVANVADSLLGGQNYWFILLFIAIVPAVCEELMFRGAAFGNYRKAGLTQGVLISALMFGIMHMNLNQFAYACVLGIIMAYIVEITGSIVSSMIIHFVINGTSATLMYFMMKSGMRMSQVGNVSSGQSKMYMLPSLFLLMAMSVVCIVAIVALLYVVAILEKRTVAFKAVNPFNKQYRVPKKEDRHVFTLPLVAAIVIGAGLMLFVAIRSWI